MSDFIDRKVLLDCLDRCLAESDGNTPITDAVIVAIKSAVEQMPTVDAKPARHGHWIRHDDELLGLTDECSECHCEGMAHGNYCPNCGCKMNEVNE